MNDLYLYNQYRPRMRTGDLMSYIGTGVVSTLIKAWSPITHVSFVLELPEYEGLDCRRWMLAADHRGAGALSLLSIDLEQYNGDVWWHPLTATDEQRRIIAEFGLCQAGKDYDLLGLLKNVWGLIPLGYQKYLCSGYVFAADKAAGLVQGDRVPRPSQLAALPIYEAPTQLIKYKLPAHMVAEP